MTRLALALGAALVAAFAASCSASEPAPSPDRSVALRPNRAYDGAPPVIPHDVGGLGRETCLNCHLTGDAVDTAGNRSGATPHPELGNCVQCHVQRVRDDVFVASSFEGGVYATGERQHALAPWRIPHPLTMRENCIVCHAGHRIPEAMKTTHPERTNCVQCHVPAHAGWPGPRPGVSPAAPR